MSTFIATFVILLTVVAAMSVGYLIKRKTISGSCGGIGAIGMDKVCDCPEPCEKRKARMAQEEARRKAFEENRII
ncbi:(Na+)-NQR maturation NqrM [Paraferrimonas sedimenticola]|uniref:(Na+)-NQR maturation NqrM n=1 Tax=Paraferrimonas sedimenticola TaxID=375674 RepID=A0AA37RWW5_9GAMM|nr:(Na+)-NQR maturation NqrM [Paraferrimonas sedimenticola]GLP96784.1 hypothetical protein GCM10007895_20900 [Paraferrimonas sedimenticola]